MTAISAGDLELAASRELPKYKSHKEVWALKIKSIVRDGEGENRETDGSAMITPEEEGYAPFRVDSEYMNKHKPEVSGYYVVYKDGYQSWSPAQAFEEGYFLLERSVVENSQETVGPITGEKEGSCIDMYNIGAYEKYAAAALQGLLASNRVNSLSDKDTVVKEAHDYANCMMKIQKERLL